MIAFLAAFAALNSQSEPEHISIRKATHRVHVESMGKGAPIVAIPGGPGFAGRALWSFGYEMQDVARVLLFDHAGTGRSNLLGVSPDLSSIATLDQTIEDLEDVRKKLKYEKWSVFGQSWGAIVAVAYAAKHPESVDRLILASVPGFNPADARVLETNLAAKLPQSVVEELTKVETDPSLDRYQKLEMSVYAVLPYYFFKPEEGLELAQKTPEGLFNVQVFAALSRDRTWGADVEKRKKELSQWKGGALIIQGQQDPTGAAMGYILKDTMLPKATVVMLNDCGHFSWMEREHTDIWFRLVRDWMGLKLKKQQTDEGLSDFATKQAAYDQRMKDGWPFGPAR